MCKTREWNNFFYKYLAREKTAEVARIRRCTKIIRVKRMGRQKSQNRSYSAFKTKTKTNEKNENENGNANFAPKSSVRRHRLVQ